MDIGGDPLRVVLGHVAPIEQYAIRIAEAHSLGHGPGEHTDVWSVEFQRKAHTVWKETLPPQFLQQVAQFLRDDARSSRSETLPPQFLQQVADSYRRCAWLMESVLPKESIAGDWAHVCGYLVAVAAAIAEDPDCAAQEKQFDSSDIGFMPTLIHYDRLAELMSVDAAEKLRATAAAVARYCRFNSPASPNEVQLACLQGLAHGEKHAELAKRLGYSERHLQRILADMWHQFGIDNATQGVAFAIAQGWVTVPINEPHRRGGHQRLAHLLRDTLLTLSAGISESDFGMRPSMPGNGPTSSRITYIYK